MQSILIVDDDSVQRELLHEVLRKAGYHTDEACTGQEAIEKATSKDYDVVLIDMIMPGISGIDAIPEIRKVRPGAKIILITGFPSVESAIEAIRKGASDYISKPYRAKDLLITVRRVIEEARIENNIEKLKFDQSLLSLSNSLRRRIVKLLSSREDGVRLNEITKALGIEDHTKALFHLRMLRDSGFIRQGKQKEYSLTRQGARAMECLNILEYYFEDR